MHHILEPGTFLAEWLAQQRQPAWRAKAIRRWIFARRAASFADMTDLPKELRPHLEAELQIWTTSIAKRALISLLSSSVHMLAIAVACILDKFWKCGSALDCSRSSLGEKVYRSSAG